MDKYICATCDYVYDPELGDPDNGVAPGTSFKITKGISLSIRIEPDHSGSILLVMKHEPQARIITSKPGEQAHSWTEAVIPSDLFENAAALG